MNHLWRGKVFTIPGSKVGGADIGALNLGRYHIVRGVI